MCVCPTLPTTLFSLIKSFSKTELFRNVNVAPRVNRSGTQLPSGSNASITHDGLSPVLPPRQTRWPFFLSLPFHLLASLSPPFSHCSSISDYILANRLSGDIVVLCPLGGNPQEASRRETFEQFLWPSLKQECLTLYRRTFLNWNFKEEECSVAYESQAEREIPTVGLHGLVSSQYCYPDSDSCAP